MKQTLYNFFLAVALSMMFSACEKSARSAKNSLPFQYTNLVFEPSTLVPEATPETLITFTNDVWFSHKRNEISTGLGSADYQVSVFFDRSNRIVRKILQQTTVGTNRYWLADINGDGLPDERQTFGKTEKEVLFNGAWVQCKKSQNVRQGFIDGKWTDIRFVEGRWQKEGTGE